MNSNLLQNLEALIAQDAPVSRRSLPISQVENRLTALLLDGNLADLETFVENAFVDVQEALVSVETSCYPVRPGLVRRFGFQIKRLWKEKLLPGVTQKLRDIYGLDESYLNQLSQMSTAIKTAVEEDKPLSMPIFPEEWRFPKIILAKRAILLDLSRAWVQENSDEPIFWKISASLQTISGCSYFAVSEAFTQTCLAASDPQKAGSKDSIVSFFIELNDDKAGNILDNLLLSQGTYQTMIDEGWQPDRWEVENLPMSIGMFLDFMAKNGFKQVENIGNVLEIDLKSATERYRYRGSPFLSSDDLKKVNVSVPGWEMNGELVIRPKVTEFSSRGA